MNRTLLDKDNALIAIREQRNIAKDFKLEPKGETCYFKCFMYPFDGMTLCQYRDITDGSFNIEG
ncbi:hypothetical protein [uncultured Bacteroides sp.]|uniref:hypothetical protein n=1 Tax=uncultured Bacteroides sp. TaxID=162156 RepID=UPI0025FC8001|nr:hypothetical protein [uncultured Bacteroides sp.]